MALTPDNDVPLPKNIQATLAWDNIDRIEGTLNISSSKCHSCLSQAFWSRNLLPPPGTEQARTRKRNIDPPIISLVPPYNAGDRTTRRRHEIDDVHAQRKLDQSL